MKTIYRQRTRLRPAPNPRSGSSLLQAFTPQELIRKADEFCALHNFDYHSQIYRVIESTTYKRKNCVNEVREKKSKTCSLNVLRKADERIYYEVLLRKIN